jgi:hypothetical protein
MIIDLSKITFTNDFFSTMLPDGSLLVLNKVDEDFLSGADEDFLSGADECIVKAINTEIQNEEEAISCPCVIGLGNDLMQINTDHKEYEGKVLTPDNMMYCTIEVYEG